MSTPCSLLARLESSSAYDLNNLQKVAYKHSDTGQTVIDIMSVCKSFSHFLPESVCMKKTFLTLKKKKEIFLICRSSKSFSEQDLCWIVKQEGRYYTCLLLHCWFSSKRLWYISTFVACLIPNLNFSCWECRQSGQTCSLSIEMYLLYLPTAREMNLLEWRNRLVVWKKSSTIINWATTFIHFTWDVSLLPIISRNDSWKMFTASNKTITASYEPIFNHLSLRPIFKHLPLGRQMCCQGNPSC